MDASAAAFRSTGVRELDRVLGGGLVPGAVILLAGEPGIGKSTLLLDVAAQTARGTSGDGVAGEPRTVLYLTGEESAAQVRMRGDRIGALAETLHLAAETDLGRALGQIERVQPSLVVVDSVQTLQSAEVEGVTGRYFANSKPKASSKASQDTAAAARLWDVSSELVGLPATPNGPA